jgi:hypothetical protein
MNTRPSVKRGKYLVVSDLARVNKEESSKNTVDAKAKLKLMTEALAHKSDKLRMFKVVTMLERVEGPVQFIILLLVDEKLTGLDPTMGLGEAFVFLRDIMMGFLMELEFLIEPDDDTDDDNDTDTDEDSLP